MTRLVEFDPDSPDSYRDRDKRKFSGGELVKSARVKQHDETVPLWLINLNFIENLKSTRQNLIKCLDFLSLLYQDKSEEIKKQIDIQLSNLLIPIHPRHPELVCTERRARPGEKSKYRTTNPPTPHPSPRKLKHQKKADSPHTPALEVRFLHDLIITLILLIANIIVQREDIHIKNKFMKENSSFHFHKMKFTRFPVSP